MCVRWLAAASLLGAALACAQNARSGPVSGGVAGRLTDPHSKPLSGVTIILRNTLTGTETRATTAKNGAWRLTGLAPGEYTLEAQSPQLGQGHVEGIEISAGYEARVQAAVDLEPVPISPPQVAAVDPTPSAPPSPTIVSSTHEIPTAPTPVLTVALATQPTEALHPQPYALAQIQPAQVAQPPSLIAKVAPPPFPSAPPAISLPAKPEPLVIAHLEPTNAESAPEMASADQRSRAIFANLAAGLAALRNSFQAPVPVLDAPQLSASSTTLTGEEIRSLPVAGRDWHQFTLDAPPAGNQTSGTEGSKFGEEARGTNTVLVDGANTRLAFDAKASGRSSQSLLGPAANESAVHSVETVDQSAEGNGRTLVETRSGGPDIHAEASLFTRQNLWDAQNPFSQWIQQTSPATPTTVPVFTAFPYTPSNHEMIWSANLSGPLRRYRMRWFAAVQGSERSDPGVATVKHPTDFFAQPTNDEIQVLSARLGLPGANPVVEGLSAYSSMLESLTGLLGPAPR
ncbi:MAG TPA: carboxypeptidase-like regulatory domain-containing protein, partial [Terracidiphilus sp.]